MRTLKDLSWQVEESVYRADKALSYSTIAKFNREGFKSLKTLFEPVSTPSLIFGSLVDTLLTDAEEFNNIYAVIDTPNLTEGLIPVARELVENYSSYNSLDSIPDNILADIGAKHDFYAPDKYAKVRVKKIKEGCEQYFQFSKRTNGKTIVSEKDYQDAVRCVEELKTNPYTRDFFKPNDPFDTNREIFFQLKFKGEYEGIPLRGMLDAVVVLHNQKKIIPIDLKTSSSPEYDFPKSFIKWNYPLQANLYSELIRQNIQGTEYEDYTITSYYFIVVNRYTLAPMVWRDDKNKSLTDYETKDITIPNWRSIVKELHTYLQEETTPKYPLWVKPINSISEHL